MLKKPNTKNFSVILAILIAIFTYANVNETPASVVMQEDASYSFKGTIEEKGIKRDSKEETKPTSKNSDQPNTVISPDSTPVAAKFHRTDKDVSIKSVGLDEKGRMGTVEDPKTLSWYNTKGHKAKNLLLSSHRDWAGELGILHGLETWEDGQKLTITLDNGKQKRYKLKKVTVYHKENVPKEVMQLQTGKPRVTVITCTGTFIKDEGGYNKRAIAIFEPID